MDWDTSGVNKPKLSYRITLYFVIIVSFSLTVGFFIFYAAINRVTNQSVIGKMVQLNEYVSSQIPKTSINEIEKKYPALKITELAPHFDHLQQQVIKEKDAIWVEEIHSRAYLIKVITYPFVNGKHYQIVNNEHIIKIENKFWWSLLMVIAWIFVFIIILIIFLENL